MWNEPTQPKKNPKQWKKKQAEKQWNIKVTLLFFNSPFFADSYGHARVCVSAHMPIPPSSSLSHSRIVLNLVFIASRKNILISNFRFSLV